MLWLDISATDPFTFCKLLTNTVVLYSGLLALVAADVCLIVSGTVVP